MPHSGYPADVSLVVAVPFGVASAVVYGTSIVIQHRTAQQHADDDGSPSASGLLRTLRKPAFLLAIGGDVVGFLLQIVALATGPVVVVQPLVVLMLPVSLAVSAALGGHRPQVGDYLGVCGILAGLGVFLALVGEPSPGHVPGPHVLGMAIIGVWVVGALLAAAARFTGRIVRGAGYGAVAGAFFGTHAVLVDALSDRIARGGVSAAFTTSRGLLLLGGIVLLGVSGIVLTQLSFQVGALGATLPANLAADPLMGVLLGVALLHERIPHRTGHLIAYGLCLLAAVAGAIRLANPAKAEAGADGAACAEPA